jgi:ATP-binding cassette, subfamily B, bacterial
MANFPFYKQFDRMDCGPTCLRMIAHFYGKIYSLDFLRDKTSIGRNGVSISGIAEAAELIGLQSLSVAATFDMLAHDMPLPCIAYWKQRHFVIVRDVKLKQSIWSKIRRKKSGDWEIHLADPAYGLIIYSKEEFMRGWIGKKNYNEETDEGIVLALEPSPQFFQIENPAEGTPTKRRFSDLFAYFKPYKKIIWQLIIGLIISSVIQLAFPFLMQSTIDYGVNFQNINLVQLILGVQLALFLIETTVQILRGWLLMHITSRIRIKLLTHFLAKLMSLSIGFFDTKNVGDIMQRIQDNDRIESFLSNTTLNTLFSFFNLFIFGGILAYFNTTIFLIFLISAIVQVFWTLMFLKKRAEIDYKRFDQAAGNQSSTMQLINGMQEIRLNGSEKRRRWEWESVQIRLFRISMKGLSLAQTQNTGGSFLNESKNILITFFTATSVINGQMTLGTMLSIQYIIGQLNLPISNFISFVQIAQDAKISLDRLNEIYDKDDEEPLYQSLLKELPQDKSICIRNLNFRYGSRDSALVLKNLDLDIPAGKTTAIVGASGSGKTTLIKLLLKFNNPTEGGIFIGKASLNSISSRFWRSKCGCVMQEGYIFSDSILRNITESDSDGMLDKNRLQYASNVANLSEWVEEIPTGYNTRIGSTGIGISGGQRQRILIARAVYKNPEYIFLDEATSSLDANNEKGIMEKLETFFKGKTVVVVAHRLSTVKNADHIIVLDKGQIVEQGTHQDLVNNRGSYYTLVKNQLELGN